VIARVAQNRALLILLGAMAVTLAALLLVPVIPQDQSYHQFADQRALLGVPNFRNVVSNLPFIVIGAIGLARFHRDPVTVVLFGGILLTGFGSSYYHWSPSDSTLLWDRLPMTLGFMAILAAVIEERVDAQAGRLLLWPLLALGIVSLLVWRWRDDLRLYAWVQFFPCLALPVLFLLCRPKYSGASWWVVAAVLYALAKVMEYTDRSIYLAGSIVSGHTIKHLAAGAACYAILRYYQTRQPIKVEDWS
jgi:Ceramidase